jgi:hypothetical protein
VLGAEREASRILSEAGFEETSGDDGVDDFLPGLLANYEMIQRSNPALSKSVNRKMPSKAHY